MVPDWQNRRSALNHDWLKNRYITAVASFVNILTGLVEDAEAEGRFIHDTLPEWVGRKLELYRLIDDFETEMSPRTLFEKPPLCRSQFATDSWLPNVAHQIWRYRVSVDSICADARERVVRADVIYQRILEAVRSGSALCGRDALGSFRKDCEAFQAACEELSIAISRFPHKVEVV